MKAVMRKKPMKENGTMKLEIIMDENEIEEIYKVLQSKKKKFQI